jgi:hypothetical protein
MDDILIEPIKLIELHDIVFPTTSIPISTTETTNIINQTNNNNISTTHDKTNIINIDLQIQPQQMQSQQIITTTKILTNTQKQEDVKILTDKSEILNENQVVKLKQIELNNYYLSFDCACATLGYILTEITDVDVDNFFIDENIINPRSIKLKIIKQGVINLVEGFLVKDVPVRNQIYNLRVFLDSLVKDIDISNIHVIIEDQPYINDNSNQIQSGLYMYFAYAKSVVSVQPTYKNTICFDRSLNIQNFYEKYSKTYSANKEHAAQNLSYYYKINNIGLDIKKSLYNHLGDAFMQFIYIIKEKVLVVVPIKTTVTGKYMKSTKKQKLDETIILDYNSSKIIDESIVNIETKKHVTFTDRTTKIKIPIESKASTINSLITNNKIILAKKKIPANIPLIIDKKDTVTPVDVSGKVQKKMSKRKKGSKIEIKDLVLN